MQPFGCISNHIVAKGVEKKIKALYPGVNLLALDYDEGKRVHFAAAIMACAIIKQNKNEHAARSFAA
ncbi:MAG: hypothetical protein LBC63_00540 [Holophagales bacterium]|nr:hypothetical protein [Holophagales bacterium]